MNESIQLARVLHNMDKERI